MKRFILVTLGFIVLLATLTIIPSVTAFEFDDKLSYSPDDKKVTFVNWFGLGRTNLEMELVSHEKVNEPKLVFPGKNVTVMKYKVSNYLGEYLDGIQEVEITNMKTGAISKRSYNLRWEIHDTILTPKYELVCKEPRSLDNGSKYKECTRTITGYNNISHIKESGDVINGTIPEGTSYISLQVDVYDGDHYDGVFTVMGKKITRHSTWTTDLNFHILAYYTFDDADGTDNITLTDTVGLHDVNGTPTDITAGEPGLIGQSYRFNGVSSFVNLTDNGAFRTPHNFSISLWHRINTSRSATLNNGLIANGRSAGAERWLVWLGADTSGPGSRQGEAWHTAFGDTITSAPNDVNIEWTHVFVAWNDTSTTLYINGTFADSTSPNRDLPNAINTAVCLGIRQCDGAKQLFYLGHMDEIGIWNTSFDGTAGAVAAQLYNNGLGIQFTNATVEGPNVTLISPANNTITNNATIDFNVTAVDDVEVINVSVYINGVLNFTQVGDGTNFTGLNFTETFTEGTFEWYAESFDDISERGSSTNNFTFTIDQTTPTVTIVLPFNDDIQQEIDNIVLNYSVTDTATPIDTCKFSLDQGTTNTTIANCLNTTFSGNGFEDHNLLLFANDTAGNENFDTINFTLINLTQAFQRNTIESRTESYTLNVSSSENVSLSTSFIYNGTSLSGITNTTRDFFNVSQQLGLIGGSETSLNNSLNWTASLTFNSNSELFNAPFESQIVNRMIFVLCNGTINVPFLEFTFQNETTAGESVDASIDSSTFTFFTFDATKNRSLAFSSVTENTNYTFCFEPANEPVTLDFTMKFSNSESAQRTFTSIAALTNVTTNQLLFLLPTVDGLFTTYQTVISSGETIRGVGAAVSRIIGGTSFTIASGITDAAGLITFFLDPDESYTYVFSKTGFADNTFSLVPNQAEIYKVTMGQAAVTGSFTSIGANLTYAIEPANATLINNTDFTFSFNVTLRSDITQTYFNITNITGDVLLTANGTGGGFINGSLNTGNETRLIGYFVIETENETSTITKVWVVGDFFQGDYSLDKQLRLYLDYDFGDFFRILIVLATLMGIIIYMSTEETIDTTENKLIVAALILWAFSTVGWMDTGIVPVTTTGNLSALTTLANQFGIAFLFSVFAASYVGRRLLERV